jgi:hypothetical protein
VTLMHAFVDHLRPEDIRDVAAYYSSGATRLATDARTSAVSELIVRRRIRASNRERRVKRNMSSSSRRLTRLGIRASGNPPILNNAIDCEGGAERLGRRARLGAA